jgi:mannan endo-1,4-beta-mannosidase
MKRFVHTVFIRARKDNRIVYGLVAAVAVAAVGAALVAMGGAATFVTAFEAESGARSGAATLVQSPAGASGNTVRFGGTTTPSSGFVTRNGKDLMLDGQVYKFVGYNYFGLTGCADGTPDSQATVDRYFSGLRPVSTTRVWAFQPQGMTGIDRVVASAERYNQKVIFAMADGAQYCGDTGYNASFYQSGFRGNYFNWVQQVVSRHKNSKAILAWETMNEPCHTGAGGVTRDVMRRFFDDTAAHIKTHDPNHLVFTGSLAEYDCGGALSDFAYVHGGPNIDGGSLHEYDYLSVGQRGASSHWNAVRPALHGINKVAYVGEVGVGPDGGCLSDSEMSSAHKQKLDGYMNAGASGVLVWGFDDNRVCGIYSGRQITFGSQTESMFKSYAILGSPTTPPSPPPPPPPPGTAGSQNDSVFGYTGTWQSSTGTGKYQDDDHYSSTAGSYYTYQFSGTQVKLYGAVASHHGIAAVSIDGGAETNIDFYNANRAEQQLLYTSPVLSNGTHTIKVRVTGNKNASSSDLVVTADRIDVL